jgi:non-ribosomal peptide synthetase component F
MSSRGGLLHELIEASVARNPDAPALRAPDGTLTYEQMLAACDGFASTADLDQYGPSAVIGVCADRSLGMVVAMLSILRSGAAYLPLDPAYPGHRLAQIVKEAAPSLIATGPGAAEAASALQAPQVEIDFTRAATRSGTPTRQVKPEDPAYVIFTSGSSGRPKSVVVEHRQAVWSTLARHEVYYNRPPSRFLLLSSIAFDSSVAGIFWTLSSGGTLIVPDSDELADPEWLAACAVESGVTHLLTVPTFYRDLLQKLRPGDLTTAIVAGEQCPSALVEEHYRRFPQVALFNEYGPTETTVWATSARLEAGREVTLGGPIPGATISIRDEGGSPVGEGETPCAIPNDWDV